MPLVRRYLAIAGDMLEFIADDWKRRSGTAEMMAI